MLKKTTAFAATALLCLPSAQVLADDEDGINIGGAVRFQYSYEDYNPANRTRSGDFDFDTFRFNLDGSIGDVILSAELRYYQYMEVIHHAWVGYDFNDAWQGRLGIAKVPFGVLPFNSHNFFFSSAYYVGLEDDYDFGAVVEGNIGAVNLQLGFFKNDEQGGVDGFVSNRSDRYSYDVVGIRDPASGIFDDPDEEIGEANTAVIRAAYNLAHSDTASTEFGVSGLRGSLKGLDQSVGDYYAYAVHLNGTYGPFNLMLQFIDYEYDLDSGGELLVVGAYSFFDTIATEAQIYTANLAWSLPLTFGPVTGVQLYNNYSLVTEKSADLRDTQMNVTGFSVAAGGIFAYFDFILGRNQPFIGGTMAGDDDRWNARFNVNVGYYF